MQRMVLIKIFKGEAAAEEDVAVLHACILEYRARQSAVLGCMHADRYAYLGS